MALSSNAFPVKALGVPDAQWAYLEYSVASGAVTLVRAPIGWSLGNFTAGVAALTFPKHYAVVCPVIVPGDVDDAAAASRHLIATYDIDEAGGTATVRSSIASDGTSDTPADGKVRLLYLVGD